MHLIVLFYAKDLHNSLMKSTTLHIVHQGILKQVCTIVSLYYQTISQRLVCILAFFLFKQQQVTIVQYITIFFQYLYCLYVFSFQLRYGEKGFVCQRVFRYDVTQQSKKERYSLLGSLLQPELLLQRNLTLNASML